MLHISINAQPWHLSSIDLVQASFGLALQSSWRSRERVHEFEARRHKFALEDGKGAKGPSVSVSGMISVQMSTVFSVVGIFHSL